MPSYPYHPKLIPFVERKKCSYKKSNVSKGQQSCNVYTLLGSQPMNGLHTIVSIQHIWEKVCQQHSKYDAIFKNKSSYGVSSTVFGYANIVSARWPATQKLWVCIHSNESFLFVFAFTGKPGTLPLPLAKPQCQAEWCGWYGASLQDQWGCHCGKPQEEIHGWLYFCILFQL